jgi:hypothetical protein
MTKKNTKAGAKAKKLGLRKETLKDLSGLKGKATAVKGGGLPTTRPGCGR